MANFHFRVAFGERPVVATPGLTEFFFVVEFSGGAKLRAFGITFAGVNISASVTASGEGRVPLVVSASAEVEFLFFSVSVSMSFTLGYVELPKKVYLAGNPSGDARLWNPAAANGVLALNMGDRNATRGIAEDVGNELYLIEHLGSDASGETLRVVFSGRETIFKGVKKVVAFGGDGDDHIYIDEGVTADVEFHGGGGNDVFIYEGSGTAWLYGDGGDDYIVTGEASNAAFLYGGDGRDYIVHSGRGRAEIDGGAGQDKIYGGAADDLIHGGADGDEIDGRGGVDQLFGDGGDDMIHWDYADLVLGTVDGGTGYDILDIVGQKGVDDFRITSLLGSKFKVANFKAGVAGGLDHRQGLRGPASRHARRRRQDHAGLHGGFGPGLQHLVLSAGKNVVRTGTEMVTDPESGQPIEQDKFAISDDRAPDTVTILGHDGIDDVTLSDTDDTDVGSPASACSIDGAAAHHRHRQRAQRGRHADRLRRCGGNDSIDASAVATDRARAEDPRRRRRRHAPGHALQRRASTAARATTPTPATWASTSSSMRARARSTAWTTTATGASTRPTRTRSTPWWRSSGRAPRHAAPTSACTTTSWSSATC